MRAPNAHPGQIDFNLSEDPHSLNPIFSLSDDEREISHLMFDMLLDVDSRGRLVPDLALAVPSKANHEISADGRTIMYRLRDDVRWQDGQPLTASDVVYTWHAIMDPDNDVPSTKGYNLVDLIFAPDPYTVVIRLKHPWAPAVATLFTYGTNPVPILPAHILQDQDDLRRSDFNLHPVGSGPYKLVRWTRDQELVFAANDQYFRGAPKIPTVVAHIVPDTNTTLTMLRSGQLDWALQSPAQRLALRDDPNIRMHYVAYSGVGALAFNCRRPPFSDARMRFAVAMSIDRRRLSAAITGGQYPVAQSDQPPFSWAHDPSARLPAFDPARADALFDALGWRRGADGLRRKNGRVLSLTLTTFPEGDTAVRTAEYVQEMLRNRGIDAAVKKVTVAQFYLPASQHGLLLSGNYDLAYMVWRAGPDPDDSDLVTCRGEANYAGICDGRLDGLERQALTVLDMRARRALYFAIQERLAELLPYDFLYAPTYGYAVQRNVRGFSPSPYSPTWNAYAWSKQ
jgi:peptide/nickel transport system substrate-binding protein